MAGRAISRCQGQSRTGPGSATVSGKQMFASIQAVFRLAIATHSLPEIEIKWCGGLRFVRAQGGPEGISPLFAVASLPAIQIRGSRDHDSIASTITMTANTAATNISDAADRIAGHQVAGELVCGVSSGEFFL